MEETVDLAMSQIERIRYQEKGERSKMLSYFSIMDSYVQLQLGSVIPRPKKKILELSFKYKD